MADLTTSVLKAISIIADKSIEEVSSNKTIKATIKKVISTSEGKYLVNYNNGDFYVYTQPGNTSIYEIFHRFYFIYSSFCLNFFYFFHLIIIFIINFY